MTKKDWSPRTPGNSDFELHRLSNTSTFKKFLPSDYTSEINKFQNLFVLI